MRGSWVAQLAVGWIVLALGSPVHGQGLQEAGTSPSSAQEGSVDQRVQAARATLQEQEATVTDLKRAIRVLMAASDQDPEQLQSLRRLLAQPGRDELRLLIIEELEVAGEPAALPEILPLLAGAAGELQTQARSYALTLARDGARRAEILSELTRYLGQAEAPVELVGGAAAVAGLLKDLSLVPALQARLQREVAAGRGPLAQAVHEALQEITVQDLPLDPVLWQQWWQDHGGLSREQLLESALQQKNQEIDRIRRQVVSLQAERLSKATAAECMDALAEDLPEVRLRALEALRKLATRRNGQRDPTLDTVRTVVEERLLAGDGPQNDGPQNDGPRGEELRLLSLLLTEIPIKPDPGVQRLLSQRFVTASDLQTCIALLDAVVAVSAAEPDPGVLRRLRGLLQDPSLAVRRQAVVALGKIGVAETLDLILPLCEVEHEADAEIRGEALRAATQIAIRSGDGALQEGPLLELLTATLGNSDAPAETRHFAARNLGLLVETLSEDGKSRIFEAFNGVISVDEKQRDLSDQCSRLLCRIAGMELRAAALIAERLLSSESPSSALVSIFLTRLKELSGNEGLDITLLGQAVLPAIASHLTPGGPTVTPNQSGQLAWEALEQLRQRALAGNAEVGFLSQAAQACEVLERFAWAASFLDELLKGHAEEPQVAERVAELRWRKGKSLARVDFPGDVANKAAQQAWEELTALLSTLSAAQTPETLELLVQAAGRLPHTEASRGAQYGHGLLDLWSSEVSPRRRALVEQVAQLHLHAGEAKEALTLLDRESDGDSVPVSFLRLMARAAERIPEQQSRALQIYQRLVGESGQNGLIAADDPQYLQLVFALGKCYLQGERRRELQQLLPQLTGRTLDESQQRQLVAFQEALRQPEDGEPVGTNGVEEPPDRSQGGGSP